MSVQLEVSKEQVITHAEKAWKLLHDLKLLPTPENYTVFYAFCEGQDRKVFDQVSAALQRYQTEPAKLADAMQQVYEQVISNSSREAVVRKTAETFDEELKELLEIIEGAQKGADQYGKSLNTFGEGIAAAPIDQIKAMVTTMVAETLQMSRLNGQLQEQLTIKIDEVHALQDDLNNVKQEALRDPLTGINNRKAFTAELMRATAEACAENERLSLAMIDIDFFKKFNDRYGHLIGDQVLKLVAHTLKENVKGRDTVARWGGEEFALLLPQTQMDFAVKLADNLRNIVAHKKILRKPSNEDLGQITLSIGVTEYLCGEDVNDFVDRADQALYRAKQEGRNRVLSNDLPTVKNEDGQ